MPTVIVAIPEEQDRVWKISSQKVPHMTLQFLGDGIPQDDLLEITLYVQHAASMLHRFGMSVDRRGTLGDLEADVLFFDDFNKKWLNDFRSNLLQQDAVKRAHANAEQFENWVPHLTLGFPDEPAKEDDLDFGIGWVSFDRIAVWTGDFEGPEFVLPKWDDMAMAETAQRFLTHHGVKGMKWGVRKRSSGGSGGSGARTKFTKGPSRLSDLELGRRIKRMETEKRYNELNAGDLSKGRRIAEEILTDSGKRIAKTVVTGGGLLLIRAALNAKFGDDVGSAVTKRLK